MQGCCHTAKNSVLISYMFFSKPCYPIPSFLPSDYAVIVLIPYSKITVGRMLCPFNNSIGYSQENRKVHVSYPHRYHVKAIPYLYRIVFPQQIRQHINCNRILTSSVNNACKIVFHIIIFSYNIFNFDLKHSYVYYIISTKFSIRCLPLSSHLPHSLKPPL